MKSNIELLKELSVLCELKMFMVKVVIVFSVLFVLYTLLGLYRYEHFIGGSFLFGGVMYGALRSVSLESDIRSKRIEIIQNNPGKRIL